MSKTTTTTKTAAPKKTAAAKTAAPKKTTRSAKRIADNLDSGQVLQAQFTEAVKARVATLEAKKQQDPGTFIAVEWARITKHVQDPSFARSLAMLHGALDLGFLLRILPNVDTRGETYVQAKTVEKIVKMIHAFALRDLSKLDGYQQQVIFNALYNGDALTIRAAQASLSRRVSNEGLSETLKSRGTNTPGTATSQASQVREVLRLLGIAQVNKGARDDKLVMHEDKARVLREVFATVEDIETEGGEE